MQLLVTGLFGAVCLAAGYLVGALRAELLQHKTRELLKQLDSTIEEYETLRDDIRLMIENGEPPV